MQTMIVVVMNPIIHDVSNARVVLVWLSQPELWAQDELFRLLNVDLSKEYHGELDMEIVREIVRDWPKTFSVKNRYVYGDFVRKLFPIFHLVALKAPADVVEAAYAANPFSIMDELDSNAQSVVHYACRYHAPLETLEFLCTVNVSSLQLRDSQGYTPLYTAISCHAPLEIIEFLIERNPDAVRIPDKSGGITIHCACKSKAPLEVVQALLSSLKKPENAVLATDNEGWTPLHVGAAHDADVEVMEYLIELAPSVTEIQTKPPAKEPKEDHPDDEDENEEEQDEEEEEDGDLALDIARNHQADADVIRLLVKSTPGATFRMGERLAKSKRKVNEKKKTEDVAVAPTTKDNDKTVGVEQAREEEKDEPEKEEDEEEGEDAGSSWFCCSRRKQQPADEDDDEEEDEEEERKVEESERTTEKQMETAK